MRVLGNAWMEVCELDVYGNILYSKQLKRRHINIMMLKENKDKLFSYLIQVTL